MDPSFGDTLQSNEKAWRRQVHTVVKRRLAQHHHSRRKVHRQGRVHLPGEESRRYNREKRDTGNNRRWRSGERSHYQPATGAWTHRDVAAASARYPDAVRVLLSSQRARPGREERRNGVARASRPWRAGKIPDNRDKSGGKAAEAIRGALGYLARHGNDGTQ